MQRSDSDILVNLPSGKISKSGERKSIRKQKPMTCILYGMRRIGFFDQNNFDEKKYISYREIKKSIPVYKRNHAKLCEIAITLCQNNDINVYNALKYNDSFNYCYINRTKKDLTENKFFDQLNDRIKWSILYEIIMEKILLPLMNIKNINWHPRDGFDALAKSLNEHGAHAFIGKFGSFHHTEAPVSSVKESTEAREVLYFKKDTYNGDTNHFAHCVVVDQVKIIHGKEMVFFRDPMYASEINKPEKIFMLSYESFVQRLEDWNGRRFIHGKCSDSVTYGKASNDPEKFGHISSSKATKK